MEPLVRGLLHGFEKNHAYALALVADLSEEQMVVQPAWDLPKPMNHAAWVLCHLKTYRPLVAGLIASTEIEDPLDSPFGMKSSPQSDRSAYPAKETIIAELEAGKTAVENALGSLNPDVWSASLPIERWQNRWGCVGVAVTFLMLEHESIHLGQLSAWRRALGLPPT